MRNEEVMQVAVIVVTIAIHGLDYERLWKSRCSVVTTIEIHGHDHKAVTVLTTEIHGHDHKALIVVTT